MLRRFPDALAPRGPLVAAVAVRYTRGVIPTRIVVVLLALLLSSGCGSYWLKRGDEAAQRGDWPGALSACRKAVQSDPQSGEARSGLAQATAQLIEIHMDAGRRLAGQGRFEDACRRVAQADGLRPGDALTTQASRDVCAALARRVDTLLAGQRFGEADTLAPVGSVCPGQQRFTQKLQKKVRSTWLATAKQRAAAAGKAGQYGGQLLNLAVAYWLGGEASVRSELLVVRSALEKKAALRMRLKLATGAARGQRILDAVRAKKEMKAKEHGAQATVVALDGVAAVTDMTHDGYVRPNIAPDPLSFARSDADLLLLADAEVADQITGVLRGALDHFHGDMLARANSPATSDANQLSLLVAVWLVAPERSGPQLAPVIRELGLPDIELLRAP